MKLPDLSKLKLKKLTCKDCITRSRKGKPYCYPHKKDIKLDQKACRSVTVKEK